jgi:hypothetical protein
MTDFVRYVGFLYEPAASNASEKKRGSVRTALRSKSLLASSG